MQGLPTVAILHLGDDQLQRVVPLGVTPREPRDPPRAGGGVVRPHPAVERHR